MAAQGSEGNKTQLLSLDEGASRSESSFSAETGSAEKGTSQKKGVTRRRFLQILGTASAAGVAGCADDKEAPVFPRLKNEDGSIPGIPAWFASTCTECTARCGIVVKTIDGRAVKVEGNKESPINRGSLCALGQSSLQNLYDPDRIREPLVKALDPQNRPYFKPISWDEALAKVVEGLNGSKKHVFLSGETFGSYDKILNGWTKAHKVERVVFDPLQPVELAHAVEEVFGEYGIPQYRFENAEVILNFGADFLETWVSPVEFGKDWSRAKRGDASKGRAPVRFIHVEPRLSLTGANADLWLTSQPGNEVYFVLGIINELLRTGAGAGLSGEIKEGLARISRDISIEEGARRAGIPHDKAILTARYLGEAKTSLVLAGGSAASTEKARSLQKAVLLLNVLLGNVGESILLSRMRKPKTSVTKVASLIDSLNKNEIGVLFVHDTNPAFTLPSSQGFSYAARKASMVVAVSSQLDETSSLADVILPIHTGLERWNIETPYEGIYSLQQPVMAPIFKTKDPGDVLFALAEQTGATLPEANDAKNMREFVKAEWKDLLSSQSVGGDFALNWIKSLEKGGQFEGPKANGAEKRSLRSGLFADEFVPAESFRHEEEHGEHGHTDHDGHGTGVKSLTVLPFHSVKAFDGRAANRPWLQELPDPITQIVWDSWAEIHPDTAKSLDLKTGDLLSIRNTYGEVKVPAYLTKHVHPSIVAVPIGQGHQAYGRYAKQVGGGNVLELLPQQKTEAVALLSATAELRVLAGKYTLVSTSGSDSQLDRGLARTRVITPKSPLQEGEMAALEVVGVGKGHHGPSSEGHEPLQMYHQREHPLYKWGMSIDLAACTGCAACVVACYAENNITVVGKDLCALGREMSWLRIERYYDTDESEELRVSFLPMLCQHCNNAPCEPVCPVYATYHNDEGLNEMVYNRCVGTRYCSNNCSYKVRRFNWVNFEFPEPLNWQINPEVTKRTMGVMEKCTFCVHRIQGAKDKAKDEGRGLRDGDVQPACAQSCPTDAIVFGNLNDPESRVSKLHRAGRAYKILDHHINTQPSVSYLEDVKYKL